MDVADLTGRPVMEEMLTVRLDPLENGTVDPGGVGLEPALRARHPDGVADDQLGVLPSEAMDDVTLRHAKPRVLVLASDFYVGIGTWSSVEENTGQYAVTVPGANPEAGCELPLTPGALTTEYTMWTDLGTGEVVCGEPIRAPMAGGCSWYRWEMAHVSPNPDQGAALEDSGQLGLAG